MRKHRAAELHTMEVENKKHREKINVNRDAVWKQLKNADQADLVGQGEYDECYNNLERCTLDTFGTLKAKELKAFIIAHNDE